MVNAASASHKGMSNKQISGTFSLSLSLSFPQYVRVYRLDCAISEIQQRTRNNNEKHEETKTKKNTNQQQTKLSTTGYMYLARSALQITSFQYVIPLRDCL